MLYSEFKNKEVINIRDCRCLGRVTNFEFDECSGCICKIFVCDCGRLFCLFKPDTETAIPFKNIKQIGPDIILVDISC
ncbi:MAG: YlmC/YmxH family sporulation protein [Lachnospiraceae bacterium]|nr:YlmC/YmxH family sporulation protein [Lachnospiraceae bacterium]